MDNDKIEGMARGILPLADIWEVYVVEWYFYNESYDD